MRVPATLVALFCLIGLAPAARAQSDVRDSVARVSRAQLGARYRLGTAQPGRRFDCSGLVQYVMSVFNVLLPRTAAEQARLGVAVPRDTAQLLPGDILTFGRGKRITTSASMSATAATSMRAAGSAPSSRCRFPSPAPGRAASGRALGGYCRRVKRPIL